ncbi:single-strand DNA-binding protein [Paramicrobacterium humi]|uniref:Single-strand DNA-binding protein n=1 Tax=Paramicrobacterium humi TaxID=640635 RepID=A0A1H4Q4H5_9MICO|nr:single-stranded DNA-binding protein [Microbacterium humi]SEC14342.1 single-strand DNA-binding protein [Microbacterium humi]
MADAITVTGIVATEPSVVTTSSTAICNFRLASSLRRFDKKTGAWTDYGTNWYSVAAYRYLADNVSASLHKGDHVIVMGRLRVREWTNGERKGLAVDIDADAIGHDLGWGTSVYTRPTKDESAEVATTEGDDLEIAISNGEPLADTVRDGAETPRQPAWDPSPLGAPVVADTPF